MAHLRYISPRLGLPWRYMTPTDALILDDGSDSGSEEDAPPPPPLRVRFRILVPGYTAENVEVSLVFPTTLAEIVPIIQDARCREHVQNFPRLIPASPQPLVGDGVMIACPAWSIEVATSRRQVCIDCSAIDGRIYSALVPSYVYGASIPELVGLPRNLEFSVFAGPYGDFLRWDSQCHLADGDTIFVRHEDAPSPTVVPLHVALLGRQHWGRHPRIPEPQSHGACCVVHEHDVILHINARGQRTNFRAQIASSVGIPQNSLRIASSLPRVLNVAVDGFPCRSVVSVSEGPPQGSPTLHWVLLDVRALFMGWRSVPAPHGQISCRGVIDDLLREIGSGWRLWLRDVPFSADILATREGQILAVEVIHERIVPPQGGIEVSDEAVTAPVEAATAPSATPGPANTEPAPATGPSQGAQYEAEDTTVTHDRADDGPPGSPEDSRPDARAPVADLEHANVPFLVLKQNYDHEWVTVRLVAGVDVHDALNAAAAARLPAAAVRVPILCAVQPQPCSGIALVVGLPAWPTPGSIIAIDSRASNGRLFALHVIGHCYRHDFLKVAGLTDTDEYEVYFRDLPWPLPADSPVHPGHGDLVFICPRSAQYHAVLSLADMLQSAEGWASSPITADNQSDIAWVLGPAGPAALQVPGHRQHRARHEIAAHVGIPNRDLALSPAFGGISDFAEHGVLLRNVVVARSLAAQDGAVLAQIPVCILDLRPLLLGFDWIPCPNGILLPDKIITRFLHRCPPGYCIGRIVQEACFSRLQEPFLIQDGDVVTLAFRQSDTATASSDHMADDAQPAPADDDEEEPRQHPTARRTGGTGSLQRVCPADPPMLQTHASHPSPSYTAESDHVTRTANACLTCRSQRSIFGLREWFNHDRLPLLCHRALWDIIVCSTLLAWPLLGSILGLTKCLLALAASLGQHRGAQHLGCRGVFAPPYVAVAVVCILQHVPGAHAMQHRGDCVNCRDQHVTAARPIPTPARARTVCTELPSMPVATGASYSSQRPTDCDPWQSVRSAHVGCNPQIAEHPLSDLGVDDPLITLLEASAASPDSRAFFLAATLLETVTEHFAGDVSQSPPLVKISFNLDVDRVLLPHSPSLIHRLMQPWPYTWLLPPDWDRQNLPATTNAHLKQAVPWTHFLNSAPSAELSFAIYTDGSATTSGYAAVILACTPNHTSLLGILGGGILGCDTSPWVVDCPAALHAEHVALATAILWSLQMTSNIQCVKCELCFDCTAAGWSAEGSWQTLSHTGAIVHHLDMLARATPGVQLKYSHVKGHSDHPWNDLADYVAKDASRGNVWPSPPADVCTALHTQDLTWLAVEQDARRHHAVPIYDGAVLLESPATCTACLQPEHLVPVTGGDCTQRDTTGHRCWASVATVNVQSLRGKCKYIEEQLHSRAVNVACLQETKLDDGTITSQYYLRIHSKAESHWGVAIWVHRQLGIVCLGGEPLHVDEHDVAILHASPRLLVLLITKGQPRIGLISGHCPHSTRPAERDEFLALTAPLLRRLKHANLVLGGLDLNGRIPPNYQDVSGALEYGEPDATGWNFARLLAESGLWVPSLYTQLHCGDSATYTHPSGTQHRIDYTLLGGQAVLEKVRSEVDDTFGNGSPQDDHMLLCLSFQGHLETRGHTHRLRRTRYDRDKIMSTEGRACLSRLLPTFCQPGWHVAPDQHCRAIEHHLCHILEANFPARQTHKRASYIPDRVWHLREKKIEFKRRVRHRSQLWHDLVCRAFHQWKESQDYGVTLLLGKQCRLYELAAAVVKITTGAIKREILQAKNTYLHKVACEGHQGAAKILQRVKQAGIGGTKARPISRPLPMLLHPSDGSTVTTRRQRDEVWMLHFGKQEQGQATPIDAFIKEATYSCYQPDLTWTAAMLPTYADIESVVRAIPRNKAAGLDNIPGEILKAVPAEAARLLLPLFLKSMVLQHQPIQWRGGVLFEAFKRSGLQSSVDNYRSLFVSSYLAKAFHRVVRDKTQAFCRDEMHSLHLGSKKRAPVTFASMYVLAHLRRGSALRQSVSVLYLDTSAAYYRIVRELAVGDIRADSTVLRLFTRFGLTGDDLHELMMTVESGGMLAQAGAPDALRQVVKDIHLHTWFVSRFSDGTQVCSSLAGSRPGESWADLIYAYIYGRVLSKIHEYAVAEDLTFRVSHDPTAGVFPATDPTGFVDATDATWADDSAFPLIAEDPGSLMQKTRRLCTLVISFCEGHGMAPNLKPGKTSVMISLKGKGHNKS